MMLTVNHDNLRVIPNVTCAVQVCVSRKEFQHFKQDNVGCKGYQVIFPSLQPMARCRGFLCVI